MLGNFNRVRGKRLGVMLHYDDSSSDPSGLEWLTKDPACHVSYNIYIERDGTVIAITPEEARAWHAGVCTPSSAQLKYTDANSALYGVAIAANGSDTVTPAQLAAVVALCRSLFQKNGWLLTDGWRITSHSLEAAPHGRKVDCEGQRATKVLDPAAVRTAVGAT